MRPVLVPDDAVGPVAGVVGNWLAQSPGCSIQMIPALMRWKGDHAMTKTTTRTAAVAADIMLLDDWFDPIEDGVRERVRGNSRHVVLGADGVGSDHHAKSQRLAKPRREAFRSAP